MTPSTGSNGTNGTQLSLDYPKPNGPNVQILELVSKSFSWNGCRSISVLFILVSYLLILYVFLFSCVPEDECGRLNNKLTVKNSDLLLTKEALAENSNCDGPNDVCCHEDDILYFYPEDKMCSAIDGYTYVLRKVFLIPMVFQICIYQRL